MTQFDKFKNMDIDQLADWLDEHGQFDGSPWISWFDYKYCKNCPDIMCHYLDSEYEFHCSWCELEGKCKYFSDLNEAPDNKMIIKMWIESDADE